VIITFFWWGLDTLVWEEGKGESKVVAVFMYFLPHLRNVRDEKIRLEEVYRLEVSKKEVGIHRLKEEVC
jgi:hypothetical protein